MNAPFIAPLTNTASTTQLKLSTMHRGQATA